MSIEKNIIRLFEEIESSKNSIKEVTSNRTKLSINEADISGIDELVYNPATKKGGSIGFGFDGGKKVDGITWGNHDNHLHIGFTNREVAMDVIDKAHQMGLTTTENPYAKKDPNKKVDNVHTNNSFHYKTFEGEPTVGAGVDISGNQDTITGFMKWVIQKYSGGNYTVDQTTDSTKSSEDAYNYATGKNNTQSPSKSNPEYARIAGTIKSVENINENRNLGKNTSNRYGKIIIPKEDNPKIKSPISGKINNRKFFSGCVNQTTIEYDNNGTKYLQYCGISNPSLSTGDVVSAGSILGNTDSDVEVTLYDYNWSRIPITYENVKTIGKGVEKDSEKKKGSSEPEYWDPLMAALMKAPLSIFKDKFDKEGNRTEKRYGGVADKKQVDPFVLNFLKDPFNRKKVNENIERIKKML